MRAKRSKQYRKLMQQYGLTFGFREPYQVLIDSGVIIAASRYKMQLGHLLQTTLHGNIKPMISQCCIRHLYSYPATTAQEKAEKEQWIAVAKAAERRRCGHHELETPLSERTCIQSCVDPKDNGTNKHKYVIASQELGLRQVMREISGVPLIYINRSVMILEPMSVKSEHIRNTDERGKMKAGLIGARGLKRKLDVEHDDDFDGQTAISQVSGTERSKLKARRAKGVKEPNPLSVKKSKRENVPRRSEHQANSQPSKLRLSDTIRHGETPQDESNHTEAADGKRKRKRKHKNQTEGLGDRSDDMNKDGKEVGNVDLY